MKKPKTLFNLLFILTVIMLVNDARCYAAEAQYTENLIPPMTGNTTPSGIITVSSSWGGVLAEYHAFDRSPNSAWAAADGNTSGWIAYEFPDEKCITKYTVAPRNTTIEQIPKDWTFEAWNEASGIWVVLDTQINVTDWQLKVKKEFTFTNNTSYKKYRINVTSTQKAGYTIVIGEIEMMETVPFQVAAPTNLVAVGGNKKVELSWAAVDGTTNYNIKRSETAGGPYETISSVSGSAIYFADVSVNNGKTYYYVVSAVASGVESDNSYEVSVTLEKSDKEVKLVLEVYEQKQLSVSKDLLDNIDMIWISSDTSVATVDANGIVEALKPGNTVITVVNGDGSFTDTINVLIVKLDLQLAVDLYVGEKCRLTVGDMEVANDIIWVVNDSTIATVTNSGKVTAINEGLTYISAIDEGGNEMGIIYIRVRDQ